MYSTPEKSDDTGTAGQFEVEIVDQHLATRFSLPISSSDPLCVRVDALMEEIFDYFDEGLVAVDVVRRGFSEDNSVPTLCLTFSEDSEVPDIAQVERFWGKFGIAGSDLELFVGGVWSQSGKTWNNEEMTTKFVEIPNGASVGSSGGAGTLAGRIRFEGDDEEYFLTCHHVWRPIEKDSRGWKAKGKEATQARPTVLWHEAPIS